VRRPWFDNQIGTLDIDGRRGLVRIEKATAPGGGDPRLHAMLERRLA